MDNIEIFNGKIISCENIKVNNNGIWKFENNDPQIIISFDQIIDSMNLNILLNDALNKITNITIYYDYQNKGFSEDKKISFNKYLGKQLEEFIYFDEKVDRVRIDLSEENIVLNVNRIIISSNEDNKRILEKYFFDLNHMRNILVYISNNDYNSENCRFFVDFVVTLSSKYKVIILTDFYCDGLNELQYKNKICVICLNDIIYNKFDFISKNTFDNEHYQISMLELIRNFGIDEILLFSTNKIKTFKQYNFNITTLILNTVSDLIQSQKSDSILKYSDHTVFTSNMLSSDFEKRVGKLLGDSYVVKQGIGELQEVENDSVEYKNYILGFGNLDLELGIDYFISAAKKIYEYNKDIRYIWLYLDDKGAKNVIEHQIDILGLNDAFFLVKYNMDCIDKYIYNANVVWITAREKANYYDLLKVMKYNKQFFGFGCSSNLKEDICNNNCVSNYEVNELVMRTKEFFNETNNVNYPSTKNMDDYISEILNITNKKRVISPNLDFYLWRNSRKIHFFNLQNTHNKTYKEKLKAIKHFKKIKRQLTSDNVILLDTSIGSDNVGDSIIMDYCESICNDSLYAKTIDNVPTHIYDSRLENMKDDLKILCGTNIIYKLMENSRQWTMPNDISNLYGTCLLGVGLQKQDIDIPMSKYSKLFYNNILSKNHYHSVRDEDTKVALENIGIKNVLNTSCPTMWKLTTEHCRMIPTNKSRNVLTTITDYEKDMKNDKLMLNILKDNYDKVYIWIQGQYDYEYLDGLVNVDDFCLIPPSLEELDKVLEQKDLDYIGTRLHAGIRSLNFKHRSLVIAIDNRARAIAHDTNLPILERKEINSQLISWINNPYETLISLPEKNINLWKNQFNKKKK